MQTDKAHRASSPATHPAHHAGNNNPTGTEAIDPITSANANANANTNTSVSTADIAVTAVDPGNNPEYNSDRSGKGHQLAATGASPGSVNVANLDLIETTLGAHQWFDVPLMLSILMLGTFSLGAELIHNYSYPSLLLIGVYAVFNLAGAVLKHRPAPAPHALARVLSHNYLPLINFFVDSGFATGVLVLDMHDRRSVITILLVMAGARFLAHLPSGSTRVALLPLLLPFIPLVFSAYFTPEPLAVSATIEDVLTLSLIVLCCLVIVFAITRKLNPRIAETARLTQALAESNEKLRESRSRTEQHAQLLAEEVLRLDLLQDCIRAMNSAVELDELLQMVVQNAVRVLKAEQSSIGLVDPDTRELVITCATGVDAASLRRRRFAPGMGVAGWVIQHGKPMLVGDVEQDPHYLYSDTDHITSSAQNEHNADDNNAGDNAGNNNHKAGLKCPIRGNIRHDIWVKLMGNVAFNPISALTRATLIEIVQCGETRAIVSEIMAETEAVARRLGVEIGVTIEQRLAGAEKVGHHKTSMLQDVEAGRPMELEPIVGAVVELGDRLNLQIPYTRTVYACAKLLARSLEKARRETA